MKKITLLAVLVGSTVPALALADTAVEAPPAAEAKFIQGCEVKKVANGNYYNLVDPSCRLSGTQDNDPSGYRLGDYDNDPETPDTFGWDER